MTHVFVYKTEDIVKSALKLPGSHELLAVGIRVVVRQKTYVVTTQISEHIENLNKLILVVNVEDTVLFRWNRETRAPREQDVTAVQVFDLLWGFQKGEKLCKNAANRPHVWLGVVVWLYQNHFRGPVPTGANVLGQISYRLNFECFIKASALPNGVFSDLDLCSGNAEITDPDAAVLVNQDVRWLEVSVHDLRLV